MIRLDIFGWRCGSPLPGYRVHLAQNIQGTIRMWHPAISKFALEGGYFTSIQIEFDSSRPSHGLKGNSATSSL